MTSSFRDLAEFPGFPDFGKSRKSVGKAMDEAERKSIGEAVKEHLAREGLSREAYCIRYHIPKGTLDKLVTGIFSAKTLAKLERHTGRSFRGVSPTLDRAADDLGAYLHADYRSYEGQYTMIRPSFDSADSLSLFPVRIDWDDAHPGLRIAGHTSAGYQKMAYLSFPKNCPYLFIHANEKGWQATMIFSTLDAEQGMNGAVLTVGSIGGGVYAPFCLPMILERAARPLKENVEIGAADPRFAPLRARLTEIFVRKYIRLA
jgi:hypothetical protein